MLRSSLNRIPGRLVFNGQSFYSKGDTTIDTDLVYNQLKVSVAGLGPIDNRDQEAYDEISITPDGSVNNTMPDVLWPYSNPVFGSGIFTDTDVPVAVHGNDGSLDTHPAAAVVQQPQMFFHPVKTLIGPLKLLCLRGHTEGQVSSWATTGSLRTFSNTGGTFSNPLFSNTAPITQDYTVTWGSVTGFAGLDFYDGLTFEPSAEFVDDEVAVHGLFNKRIKSVGGLLRGIPIGVTRTMIDSQLNIQGAGAVRGASGFAKSFSLTVTGADGTNYLQFPMAQLVKSKLQNGVEQLREGEIAWQALPSFPYGTPSGFFTITMPGGITLG